jgi:hypothetical protein
MGGSLIQITEYGKQDYYLTGNPQFSFFKFVYRRYTNFAIESIKQKINGDTSYGSTFNVTVSKVGDLITNCYIKCILKAPLISELLVISESQGGLYNINRYYPYVFEPGHQLIKSVEVKIGGQLIDKHYGKWLSIWNNLILKEDKRLGYHKMIGNTEKLTGKNLDSEDLNTDLYNLTDDYTIYIPLQFWFCRHTQLALPLIALQYNEVEFTVELSNLENMLYTSILNKQSTSTLVDGGSYQNTAFQTNPTLENVEFYIDYIYLDVDEKKRFATSNHEYLIEQVQRNNFKNVLYPNITLNLNFKNLVKELIWVLNTNKSVSDFDFSTGISDIFYTPHNKRDTTETGLFDDIFQNVMYKEHPITHAKIKLNNKTIINQPYMYFSNLQPYQYHSNTPKRKGIYMYSFSLNPEKIEPSGTCNFSNINNQQIILKLRKFMLNSYIGQSGSLGYSQDYTTIPLLIDADVFALSYNILKISNGTSNLAYSY